MEIGPLSRVKSQTAMTLLQSVIISPTLNVPQAFVDELTLSAAQLCGMDTEEIKTAIAADAAEKKKQADLLATQMQQAPGTVPDPNAGATPDATATPPTPAAAPVAASTPTSEAVEFTSAVDTIYRLVSEQLAA
jgi:hypothetical protein